MQIPHHLQIMVVYIFFCLNRIDFPVQLFLFIRGIISLSKAAYMRLKNIPHLPGAASKTLLCYTGLWAALTNSIWQAGFWGNQFQHITSQGWDLPGGLQESILLSMQTLLSKTHTAMHYLGDACFKRLLQNKLE
jgi:hypothetical protein